MSEFKELVKLEWDHFFTVANVEDGWIVPLIEAVEGVTSDEAFWKPGQNVTSIAEILLHATGWLEASLRGVLGTSRQEHDDWPAAPVPSETAWKEMQERLKITTCDLSRALHNLSLEELYSQPEGRESKRSTTLTDIFVHSAYHAGQIVKLRQTYEALVKAAVPVGASA